MPRIRGTNIVIDDFRFATRHRLYNNFVYFLSHFHADHYRGLTKGFAGGPIYCTEPTRMMIEERFPGLRARVETHGYNEEFEVPLNAAKGIVARATFLDANHIFGSAMVLFRGEFGSVLYTGDMRFDDRLPARWTGLCGADGALLAPVDELVLDNTYCDPIFRFPPQERCVESVREIIERGRAQSGAALEVHIYCYTIGKEEICLDLARHFKTKVVLDPARYRVIRKLNYHVDCFTLSATEGWIHLRSGTQSVGAPDAHRLHIHLTGWINCPSYLSLQPNEFLVAYSSHSNFAELERFVALVRPAVLSNVVVERHAETGEAPNASNYFFWLKSMPQKGFAELQRRYTDASRASEAYARLSDPRRLAELYARLGVEKSAREIDVGLFRADNAQFCRSRENVSRPPKLRYRPVELRARDEAEGEAPKRVKG